MAPWVKCLLLKYEARNPDLHHPHKYQLGVAACLESYCLLPIVIGISTLLPYIEVSILIHITLSFWLEISRTIGIRVVLSRVSPLFLVPVTPLEGQRACEM